MTTSKVAVLYTRPESVLEDYGRLFELAGGPESLDQRDDHPQGQYLLALPDARREHDTLATRRRDRCPA